MMIPMGELLAKAKKEGYGVAAPNVFNRETIEACFLAAKKLKSTDYFRCCSSSWNL